MGLGEKEARIYQLVLEYGKIAPAHVARMTKINRTTVYSVAKELIEKGLIFEDVSGRITYYSPVTGDDLGKIITREKDNLKKKEILVRELQEELGNLPASKTFAVPKIRYIEERDVESYLYEASKRWNDSAQLVDNTWWGLQDLSFVGKYEKWIHWFWTTFTKDIKLKLLTNNAEIETEMAARAYSNRRVMKFWSHGDFTATQWVVGEYVIMLVTAQRPYYLIEIRDSVMAHNLRQLYKGLWEEK